MNVNPTAPSLSGLWKLNEGSGTTVYNLINNEHLYLPSEVWSPPNWIISDADIALNLSNIEKPFESNFVNETLQEKSRSWCQNLFYREPLNQHCKTLGALVEFYYLTCVQTVARTTRISSTISVVIEFSDYCQKSLSLTIWPAQALCNTFKDVVFPYWIGAKCDVPCIFGSRDPTDQNRCKCIHGYWGSDCSKVCPGGYSNPCHGNGVCNANSGKCECDVNWRGDVMCGKCSLDWFGEQCQYAAVKTLPFKTYAIASIKGQGYFTTFLGITYHLRTFGEFYLIRSISSSFFVQVRQSPCMHRRSYRPLCTTAFAFRFDAQLSVTIRARVFSSNVYYPLVWANGKAIRVDHVTYLSATVRMTRIALNRYEITGPQRLLVVLTVGQSLSIRLRIPTSLCANSTGILGACAQRLSYQNTTDIQTLENSIKTGSVGLSESLFIYKHKLYHETRDLTGAWFNLRIVDTHLISDTLLLGNHETITIEVFVKVKSFGGTLLSYGKEKFLSVTSEEQIRLVYGSVEFKTGLKLRLNIWSQITLVWLRATSVLQLYYHDFSGAFYLRTFQFDTQIFVNQGRLYIGSWRAGKTRTGESPRSDFQGEVDEIRIWNRRSVPDLVKQNWSINGKTTLPALLHIWKLDNVEGTTAVDPLSGKRLHLPIFNKPSWDFSDLPIPRNNLVRDPIFQNATLKSLSEQFCYSVILSGPLHDNCQSLGSAVAGFYYRICLLDIASTRNISMAIESVISFADYCQDVLSLTFWPARELCHHFPTQYFPGWIGASCEVPCVFGTPRIQNGSIVCVCVDGYWGPACTELCPGGLWNVCGSHGRCDPINGTCECHARWNGRLTNATSKDVLSSLVPCSVCTDGWRGADCSIGVEHSFSNSSYLGENAICVAFGDPHVTSFSRTSYHLGITGAFEALRSKSSSLQMLQVPCTNSESCRKIREFGLSSESSNISVRLSETGRIVTNATTRLLIGNLKTLRYSTSWQEIGKTKFRWLDDHRLEVTNEEKLKLTILSYFGTLGAAIEIPRNLNTSSRGLCGSSNGDWERDIHHNLNLAKANESSVDILLDNFTQVTHDAYIDERIRIQSLANTMMMTRHRLKYKTGGGYMLRLYANYLALVQDFTYQVFSEVTIELWVRLFLHGKESDIGAGVTGRRVLCSIIQETSVLSVIYEDEITIHWGRHRITTKLVLNQSTWYQLSLAWRSNDGKLVVSLVDFEGQLRTSVHYGIMVNERFSIHRGFYIGHDGNGDMTNTELVLEIDELRIWQYARKDEDILKTMTVKTRGYIEGLVMFCGFDEGYGESSNATLFTLNQHPTTSGYYHRGNKTGDMEVVYELEPSGDGRTWQPSGAPYPNIGNYEITSGPGGSEDDPKDECFKLFYTGNLYQHCSRKLPTQTLFYYEACLMDVRNSGSLEHSRLSVSLFAFYCQKVLDVELCRLHGFYEGFEACDEEPRFTVIVIVCISIGAFLFVFLLIVIIILICKRRKKKRREEEGTDGAVMMMKYVTTPKMYGDEEDSEDDTGEEGTFDGPHQDNHGVETTVDDDVNDDSENQKDSSL